MCSELGGRELVLCGQVSELAGVGRELVRVPVRRHVVRHDVHARHLVLLLPLHTPILEPDLYLTFRQTESMRDLNATPPCQIAIEVKLFLQLQRLIPGVRGPLSFRLTVRIHRALTNVNPLHPWIYLRRVSTRSVPLVGRIVTRARGTGCRGSGRRSGRCCC